MARRPNRQPRLRIADPRLPRRSALTVLPPDQSPAQRGWKHISDLDGFSRRKNHGKIKLCVDHDVPAYLTTHLSAELNIPAETAIDAGLDRDDDEKIVQWTKRRQRLLLTFNHRDFWNEQKHPLRNAPGMIMVRIPKARAYEAAQALQIILIEFARSFPLNWWVETKVRAGREIFSFKRRVGGSRIQFAVKFDRHRLYFRKTGR